MPRRPLKQCAKPTCPKRVVPGGCYCEDHKAEANKKYDEKRGNSNSRGYGAKWRRLRKLVLNRDPICKCVDDSCQCGGGGCMKASTDADHIIPKRDGGLDRMPNLQGLCHDCHSSKTAREDGRWGNGNG